MRAVIQRVTRASVAIGDEMVARIGSGLLILLGVEHGDSVEDVLWISTKVARVRVFDGADGSLQRSIVDVAGDALVVSQFTLHASTKKGTRPSFHRAAPPHEAIPLYERFIVSLEAELHRRVSSGRFGAEMSIELINAGPVTLIVDSRTRE